MGWKSSKDQPPSSREAPTSKLPPAAIPSEGDKSSRPKGIYIRYRLLWGGVRGLPGEERCWTYWEDRGQNPEGFGGSGDVGCRPHAAAGLRHSRRPSAGQSRSNQFLAEFRSEEPEVWQVRRVRMRWLQATLLQVTDLRSEEGVKVSQTESNQSGRVPAFALLRPDRGNVWARRSLAPPTAGQTQSNQFGAEFRRASGIGHRPGRCESKAVKLCQALSSFVKPFNLKNNLWFIPRLSRQIRANPAIEF
jgi:hypothetical protein